MGNGGGFGKGAEGGVRGVEDGLGRAGDRSLLRDPKGERRFGGVRGFGVADVPGGERTLKGEDPGE